MTLKRIYYSPIFPLVLILLVLLSFPALAAYRAHQNDRDTSTFLQAYPQARDGKLDNCYLCHTGGEKEAKYLDACDYCHAVFGYKAPHPEGSLEKTLNPFGLAYLTAGRNAEALARIAGLDADGDGFTNAQEIAAGSLPGDKNDSPDVKEAPAVIYTRDKLARLPRTSQFMALDTAKSGDYFATYTGVEIWDLLQDAGILDTATDITVYSADGYSRNFSLKEIKEAYAQGTFLARYPWIKYPSDVSYHDGQQLPGKLYYLLAYERDGYPLLEGRMKTGGGNGGGNYHMSGEGPYRFIAPSTRPVVPDRSALSIDRDDPSYPYNPERPVLKNADYCIKTTVAIQVNTANNKVYHLNWPERAWKLVEEGELVVYGAIAPPGNWQ